MQGYQIDKSEVGKKEGKAFGKKWYNNLLTECIHFSEIGLK